MEKEKLESVKCGPIDENDIQEAVDLLKKYVKIVQDNSPRDVISECVSELNKTEHLKKFANEFQELDQNVSVKDLARKLSDLAGKPTMEELKPVVRYLKDLSEKVAGLNLDMADKMSGHEKMGMAAVLNTLILDGKLTENDFEGIVLCGFPKDSIEMWKELYRPANERKKCKLSVGSFRRSEQPVVVEENYLIENVELGSVEKANALLDEVKENIVPIGSKKTESGYFNPAPLDKQKRFTDLCERFELVQNQVLPHNKDSLSVLIKTLDELIIFVEENSEYNWGDCVLKYGKWLSDYEQGLSPTVVAPAKFTEKCCACEMNCRCRHKCDKTSYEKCGGTGKTLRDESVVQAPKPTVQCTDCGSPERDMTIPKSSSPNLDRNDRDNMRKFVKKLEPKNELERLCLLFEDKMKDIMKNDILYIFALKQIYQLLVENKNLLHTKSISDIESYLIWTHLLITKKQLSDDVLKTFNQHKSASCFIPGHFRDCDSENKVLTLMKSIIDSLEKSIKNKELKATLSVEKQKEAERIFQKYSYLIDEGKPFDAKNLKEATDYLGTYTKTKDGNEKSLNEFHQLNKERQEKWEKDHPTERLIKKIDPYKYVETVEEDNFIATPVDVKGTDGPFRRKLSNKIEPEITQEQNKKSKLDEIIRSISRAAKNGLMPNSAKEKNKKFHELSNDLEKAEEFAKKLVDEVKKEKVKQKSIFDLSSWQKTKVYFRDLKNKASTLFKSPEITEEELDRAIRLMEKQIAEIKKSRGISPELFEQAFDYILPRKDRKYYIETEEDRIINAMQRENDMKKPIPDKKLSVVKRS